MASKADKGKTKKKLGEYERKRDFGATPEPASKKPARRKSAPRFVVQEHSARRLHWDLRLEHEGVAASWAIPNGIPEEPSENRKAVHTEDHPLEYLDFEGEIPAGEYGAGTMRIWDRGTYETDKWEPGKIVLSFAGERLRGRYALFRVGADDAGADEKDWMIHRIDPSAARRDPFPESVVPMLARLAKLPARDDDWAVEVKWDGVRAIACCRPGRLKLQTRNLNEVTSQYPEVRRLTRQLGSREAVLDGELVAFDAEGRPSFERLQQRIHQTSESVVRRRMKSHPVTYVIFDLLYLEGKSLMGEPYSRRRELLEELELDGDSWQTPDYSRDRAKELLAASAERGLEGIVLKRLDSTYAPGKRAGSWLKVKNLGRQEFVIGGWLPGEGRRRGTLGALLLGYFDEEGELRYAGKVGTGFSDRDLDELLERLRPLQRKKNPFAGGRGPRQANFVESKLVAEIEFRELTADGMVRHGSFKGLREDKEAAAVRLEREQLPETAPALELPPPGSRKRTRVTVEGRQLTLSNLDQVLYPSTGFTKGELIKWYARMAEVLLPHLRDRPLTMRRCPNGVDAGPYCLVNDLPTLVSTANLAEIELHASLSLAAAIERPTAVVFDLDPGAPADVLDCAQVAIWIRGMFERLGLRAHAKTSGAKGLQVYVPLNTGITYEETKPFARAVAETLESKFPERVAARTTTGRRGGRVLVDWSQNDARKTTVCVYSLRTHERPTVSTPLEWDELEAALAAADADALVFDHAAVLERVAEKGDLFAPLLSERQHLPV
jgi:bifunctional non-homologous end joining protein LigD